MSDITIGRSPEAVRGIIRKIVAYAAIEFAEDGDDVITEKPDTSKVVEPTDTQLPQCEK